VNLRAQIQVTLKPGVLDPQGVAVRQALASLGFDEVTDVRVGRYLDLHLAAPDEETARRRVAAMCDTLLANPVIERYDFALAVEGTGV